LEEYVPLDLWVNIDSLPSLKLWQGTVDIPKFKYNVYIAIKFILRISKWFIDADFYLTF